MMWLVYIALALAIIIMLYVIYSIIKNIIRQTKEPIMSEKAEVSRKNKENKIVKSNGVYTVDTSGGYERANYYVTFKLRSGKLVTFKVKKKFYLQFENHQTGLLTYRGYKLICFDFEGYPVNDKKRKQMNQTAFFGGKRHTSEVVHFYGESKELDVDYHSTEKIECDQEELNRFIKQLVNNKFESFFILENKEGNVLEVSHDGNSELFDIAYMQPKSKERYLGNLTGIEELKLVVKEYFNHQEMIEKFKLTAE